MARDEAAVAEVPEASATEQNTENQAPENQTGEAQAPSAEATEKPAEPTGPTAEEVKAAVTAFQALVDGIKYDQQTGEISDEDGNAAKTAYANLPSTSAKAQARKYLDSTMKKALSEESNAAKARKFLLIEKVVQTAAATRETVAKAPVNPLDSYVEQVVALYLAGSFVDVPEGVDASEATRQVQERAGVLRNEITPYREYLAAHASWSALDEDKRGDEPKPPEVSPIVVTAAKVARGRALAPRAKKAASTGGAQRQPFTGQRGNILAHILEVFASKPVGTFMKTGEVAKVPSKEYPDGKASSGAVQARFDSNKWSESDTGLRPETQNAVKGAVKVAEPKAA